MPEQPTNGRPVPAGLSERVAGTMTPASGSMEQPPNLRDWLDLVRRHVRLVFGVTTAALALAGYVAYTSPSEYRATAVVRLVNARRALAGGLVDGDGDDGLLQRANPVLSQVEVLRSRATAGAVVDDMPILRVSTSGFDPALLTAVQVFPDARDDVLQLQFGEHTLKVHGTTEEREAAYGAPVAVGGIGFTLSARPDRTTGTLSAISRDAAMSGITARLQVKPREGTDVIDISFTASDPYRAQEVANRVARVFQAANARTAQQEARRRRVFIETQLRFNDSLLTEARTTLTAFRTQAPRSAAERTAGGPGGALAARREDLNVERRQYAGLLAQLRDTSLVTRRVALRNMIASSPVISGNVVVARLYDQLVGYERMRDSLTIGPWARAATNPDVQRLMPLIAATEADLVGAVQGVVAALDARIGVLDDLEATTLATERRLTTTAATEEALAEQVDNARRIADQLRTEYQKAHIAEAVEAGQVEIVDLAPPGGGPIGVGPVRTLLFGLLLGLLLGGGGAVVAEHLNRSLHRREDIANLGLPVLGIVPHANGSSTAGAAPIVEAMRGIRFNVMHAHGAAGPVLFTITSPGSREGKSFVASNVALAFADAGHRTLLIDGDLRRGSLYRILNTRRKPGLTDVLHGEIRPEEAIQATRYPPLFFVGCGTRTPDAPELLGSEAMSKFIAGVRQSFSVIIVDSPPLGAGVDAFALGAVTGNLLLVLRLGTTNRGAAEAKLDLLDRLPVRLLGVVLNDVPAHSSYSTYSYYLEGYAFETERGPEPRTFAGHRSGS